MSADTGDRAAAITALTATLNAGMDEDEAAAKAAWGVEWDWRYVTRPFGERPSIAHTVHIARHDPARVLRDVKASRDLIAAILAEPHAWIPGDEYYSCSQAADPDPAPGEGGPGSGCSDPDRAGDRHGRGSGRSGDAAARVNAEPAGVSR